MTEFFAYCCLMSRVFLNYDMMTKMFIVIPNASANLVLPDLCLIYCINVKRKKTEKEMPALKRKRTAMLPTTM